jgi:hypothetical protein
MIETTVNGALTPKVLTAFLKNAGLNLAFVQISPQDINAFRDALIVVESDDKVLSLNSVFPKVQLFADEVVPSGELIALDFDKNVLGTLKFGLPEKVQEPTEPETKNVVITPNTGTAALYEANRRQVANMAEAANVPAIDQDSIHGSPLHDLESDPAHLTPLNSEPVQEHN